MKALAVCCIATGYVVIVVGFWGKVLGDVAIAAGVMIGLGVAILNGERKI